MESGSSSGGGFGLVQFEADAIVHYALRPTVRVGEKFYDVGAAIDERGIEGNIFLDPISADAIALHGAGRGQWASFADGFVVGESFDVATGVSSTKRQAERGFAARRFRHCESDRPGGAADITTAKACAPRSFALVVVFADNCDVASFNSGRLDVVPVFVPIALADDEIDVVGKFFRVIEVEAPLPVMIAVAEFAGGTIGDANLPKGVAVVSRIPLELAESFLFGGSDSEVGESEFTKDAGGDGVERIIARANIRNGELALGVSTGPELVKFSVALPIHLRRKTASPERLSVRSEVGISSRESRTKTEGESRGGRVIGCGDADPDIAHFEIRSE